MSTIKSNSTEKVFLLHEKQCDDKGRRRTFAGIISNGVMSIGVSTCGPRDQFVKSLGRTISIGRATKNPQLKKEIVNNADTRELFFDLVKTL